MTSFEALLLLSFDSGTVFAGSAVTVNVWFPFWPFELHPAVRCASEPFAILGTVCVANV